MRDQPAYMTVDCPSCGQWLSAIVRFPIPEHARIKQPTIIEYRCACGCRIDEARLRDALGLTRWHEVAHPPFSEIE